MSKIKFFLLAAVVLSASFLFAGKAEASGSFSVQANISNVSWYVPQASISGTGSGGPYSVAAGFYVLSVSNPTGYSCTGGGSFNVSDGQTASLSISCTSTGDTSGGGTSGGSSGNCYMPATTSQPPSVTLPGYQWQGLFQTVSDNNNPNNACSWTGASSCGASTVGTTGTYTFCESNYGPGCHQVAQAYQCVSLIPTISVTTPTGPTSLTTGNSGSYSASASWSNADSASYNLSVTPGASLDGGSSSNSSGSASMSGPYTFSSAGSYSVCASGSATKSGNLRTDNKCISVTVTNPPIDIPVPAPTCSLSASPNSITSGNSSTLNWSSTDATSCTGDFGTISTSGSQVVYPSATRSYNINCSGATAPAASCSTSVTVNSNPTPTCQDPNAVNYLQQGSCLYRPSVYVSASPTTITSGNSSTVNWSSSGATSCTTGSWAGNSTNTSGSALVSPSQTTSYTVTCYNANGSSAGSATVTVSTVQTCQDPNASNFGSPLPCTYITTGTLSVSSNVSSSWSVTATPLGGGGGTTYQGSGTSQSFTVSPGSSGTLYTINPATVNGYNMTVSNSVTGSGSSFTLFAGQSGSFNITYTAIQQQAFDYVLGNSGTSKATKGQTTVYTQNTISKTLVSGTPQSVDLTVSGLPQGTTLYSISNKTCSPNCSSVVTLAVDPGTPAGNFPITVTGTGGRTTTFTFSVQGPNKLAMTCTPSNTTPKLGEPVTWTATVQGGVAPYTYIWSGTDIPSSPAPGTNPYNITYSTVGKKTAVASVVDSNGNNGLCIPGTLYVNFSPNFQEF